MRIQGIHVFISSYTGFEVICQANFFSLIFLICLLPMFLLVQNPKIFQPKFFHIIFNFLVVQDQTKIETRLKSLRSQHLLLTNFYYWGVVAGIGYIDKSNIPSENSYFVVLIFPFNLAPFQQKLLVSRLKVKVWTIRMWKLTRFFNFLVTAIESNYGIGIDTVIVASYLIVWFQWHMGAYSKLRMCQRSFWAFLVGPSGFICTVFGLYRCNSICYKQIWRSLYDCCLEVQAIFLFADSIVIF